MIYTGKDITSYMDAFKELGYKPEDVTKILLTHRHNDHSGELNSFPNAKIYVNEEELEAEELKEIDNIIPVKFTDGAYYNFPMRLYMRINFLLYLMIKRLQEKH